jgi:hypothetical protein
MEKCIEKRVNWAIFSDKFGVWFPHVNHGWYDKNPDNVTEAEFNFLLNNFDQQLRAYDEVMFYHNPSRFHSLYRRLIRETQLRDSVSLFSHLSEIA